jgi:hypothetical protein
MKIYEGGGRAPSFLTKTLDGSELLASRPGRFIPGERTCGTHSIEGWVGPGAGGEVVGIRTPVVQSVGRRYSD